MKKLKLILGVFFLMVIVSSCEDDDKSIGEIITPTNLVVTPEIVGQDTDNPNGDGSGEVIFTVKADNAISYRFVYNDVTYHAPLGSASIVFSNLGVNTYTVTAIAYGTGGASSSSTISVNVLATYSPPADLLQKLVGSGSKTWRIKSEKSGHFGLGPVGGTTPTEWYGAGPDEKAGLGMYDDRYIFSSDGTFTHITDNTNDNPTEDITGTVFGRVDLIDELNAGPGTVNSADVENYAYHDYSENWIIIAPGGVETITLTGLGFIGYYTGGDHRYEIFDRSVPGELLLRTTDGNNEFDWWFIITSDEEGEGDEQSLDVEYTTEVFTEEFDTNGTPDAAKWSYDTGTGTNGWGNNEEQYYTDRADNVIVEDGVLKIIAKAESFSGSNYTSARLKTQDKFEFTHGRVDVRAKLPSGGGTWPAIWMLGANFSDVGWPACGEIDIMEHVGNNPGIIGSALHTPSSSGDTQNKEDFSVPDATTEFHVYSVNWSENQISFLVDDEIFYTYNPEDKNADTWPFNANQFLILNIAMGGTLGGTIDPAFTEATMEIDYVKVFQ
ncbi:glycoside hydrolase family 16 protein [Abyssalbus ytuae]|uniref:Glycoside hydrolase family 16 protein n=1 Tax=Abyssalbus ytuae TaxID=2926907 RepID=A0A9E6ZX61_9FLAO|nr:glycoside hydrolase family 16 protein [Abyssalbus ytuae]UOB16792.1 glycoside hydrolase family 16 protein [Abyssalbus ytuae]